MQAEGTLAGASELVPAGQGLHTPALSKLPKGQHWEAPVNEKELGAQGVHVAWPAPLKVFAPQAVHAAAVFAGALHLVPAEQGTQAVPAKGLHAPRGQQTPDPGRANVLGLQGTHWVTACAPAEGKYVLLGQ